MCRWHVWKRQKRLLRALRSKDMNIVWSGLWINLRKWKFSCPHTPLACILCVCLVFTHHSQGIHKYLRYSSVPGLLMHPGYATVYLMLFWAYYAILLSRFHEGFWVGGGILDGSRMIVACKRMNTSGVWGHWVHTACPTGVAWKQSLDS